MDLEPVVLLLRERIGLDSNSLGSSALLRAVTARAKELRLASTQDYAKRLRDDLDEFQNLVDDLCVPETWFFRGGEIFNYLVGLIREECQGRASGERFRILSLPCSTGEEPYSLAIALSEGHVPDSLWSIMAVDISTRHIRQARAGRFRGLSFRQTPDSLKNRYFRAHGDEWELDPVIRERVQFEQGNLFDEALMANLDAFDLIFCRNLSIYLHGETRHKALAIIHRMLRPGGLLCVGHAEPLDLLESRFRQTGLPEFFMYQRTDSANADRDKSFKVAPPRPVRLLVEKTESSASNFAAKPASRSSSSRSLPTTPTSIHADASPSSPSLLSSEESIENRAIMLLQARTFADEGQLDKALVICEEEVSKGRQTPAVFALMGVIHQSRQEVEKAESCFQRALYLAPEHEEALTHLMLLAKGRGDTAQAERLRRRLERVSIQDAP
ncbi:methyltransferase domain-containing protein [bacterium]|nr:methyltransferase domain-containing protein [bacterium]